MNTPLADVIGAAQAEGLLPTDTTPPAPEARPWPVVLLTALGAWLAAIPLLGVVGLLLNDFVTRGLGTYAVGALLLVGAVVVLRRPEVPVFVEQLAVPALLSGAGTLAFALGRDLPEQGAAAVLAALALGIAGAVDRPWLRVLLGVAAAGLFGFVLMPDSDRLFDHRNAFVPWLAQHVSLALWLAALGLLRRVLLDGAHARLASAIESTASGWLLAVLGALAWLSGMTFLAPGVMGGGFMGEVAREVGQAGLARTQVLDGLMLVLSAGLALLAAAWLAQAWPSLRHPPAALAALVLAALAAFIPQLGAVLLALVATLTSRRWRLAGAAALAALWMVGSFYYALAWPLAYKAGVLVAAGVALGALAAWVLRHPGEAVAPAAAARPRAALALIAATVLATLGVAQWAIRDKETLIAQGQPLYVELAPVDPRSLLQGDFMRLRFSLPDTETQRTTGLLRGERLYAVARRDARGVAQLPRLMAPGETLAAGEFALQLTPKDGDWVLVTDAWFFAEGDAARWEKARYGEFRVMPDGRALLVGLADPQLKAIAP